MNPQQIMMNIMQSQMANTPIGKNLLELAKQGKGNDIEAIARNICSARGVDFDKEFSSFKRAMGIK